MTDTPEFDAAQAAIHGQHAAPQPALPQRARPTALRDLHDLAIHLNANPLISAIDAHPGMGMQLTPADVDTVLRVIASIESARIEVPARYEQATANRVTPDGQ